MNEMQTLRLYPDKDTDAITKAAEILQGGGLVAIPTETVYGLAANAFNEKAVENIFKAKGRPQDNPLIVHIADKSEVDKLCFDISDTARRIMDAFWPGPLTVILKKRDIIPDIVTCGMDTVGIRLPAHEIAREVIKASGVPLAAPSANTSGRPSPTCAEHVLEDMDGRIDAVLDGGACMIGVESTVLNLSGDHPVILRPGGVTLEMLTAVAPDTTAADFNHVPKDNERVLSPGMKYRHYAPKAHTTIITGDEDDVLSYIKAHMDSPDNTGIMCFDESHSRFSSLGAHVTPYGSRDDMMSQSASIFSALRGFDEYDGLTHIFVYATGDVSGIGMAINNRLSKAAGFDIVHL